MFSATKATLHLINTFLKFYFAQRRLHRDEIFVRSSSSEDDTVGEPNETVNQHPNNENETREVSENQQNETESETLSTLQQNVRARIEPAATQFIAAGTQQRIQLRGFVDARSNIRSPLHATALIGLLQVANGNENGVLASLGHSNRSTWMNQHINAFFEAGGPLDAFRQVSADVLQRHLKKAENRARAIYNTNHSNGGGESRRHS